MEKAGLNLHRYQKKYRPLGRRNLQLSMNNPLLILLLSNAVMQYKANLGLYCIRWGKYQKLIIHQNFLRKHTVHTREGYQILSKHSRAGGLSIGHLGAHRVLVSQRRTRSCPGASGCVSVQRGHRRSVQLLIEYL